MGIEHTPVDGVPLVIWGAAETATTIIATSIPVLRALFSDIKKSAGKYFNDTGGSNSGSRPQRSKNSTVIVSAARNNMQRSQIKDDQNDNSSDRSILPGGGGKGGRILKTAEVSIDFNSARDEEADYEMDRFDRFDRPQIDQRRRRM